MRHERCQGRRWRASWGPPAQDGGEGVGASRELVVWQGLRLGEVFSFLLDFVCPALLCLSHGGENSLLKPDDSMEWVRLETPGRRGWNPGEAPPLTKQNMTSGGLGRWQAAGCDYQGQGNQVPATLPLSLGRTWCKWLEPLTAYDHWWS